jgi:hypothetical protein
MAACRWVGETHCDELGVGAVWRVALRPVLRNPNMSLRPATSPQVPRPSSSRARPRRDRENKIGTRNSYLFVVVRFVFALAIT